MGADWSKTVLRGFQSGVNELLKLTNMYRETGNIK